MLLSISGCHGSGKTTLCDALVTRAPFLRLLRLPKEDQEDPFGQLMARLASHIAESKTRMGISDLMNNVPPVYIADRSIFDWLAYVRSLYMIGSITHQQRDQALTTYQTNYPPQLFPKYVVFLDVPSDWIRQRLDERAVDGRIRWHQSDDDFLTATVLSFRELAATMSPAHSNIFCVTDSALDQRVTAVDSWISSILQTTIE